MLKREYGALTNTSTSCGPVMILNERRVERRAFVHLYISLQCYIPQIVTNATNCTYLSEQILCVRIICIRHKSNACYKQIIVTLDLIYVALYIFNVVF